MTREIFLLLFIVVITRELILLGREIRKSRRIKKK
nr:MAG: hypothetical protein [Lokiarchaeota virus Skoll Meg22_1214]